MTEPAHAQYILWSTFALFAAIMACSPGPNNVLLASSGANHGFRKTLPLILGISIGFPFMMVAVGIGLARIFCEAPHLQTALRVAGAAYLLWMAWDLARSADAEARSGQPLNFLEAAAFQWVNPKAWVIALVAMSAYTTQGAGIAQIFWLALIDLIISFVSCLVWAGFGLLIAQILATSARRRTFNLSMAALLALSVPPLLVQGEWISQNPSLNHQ